MRIITKSDPDYPFKLREAERPPQLICQLGELQEADEQGVAIIGSRNCSELSGKRAAEYAGYLVKSGITVISGYAPGVDIKAHVGALEGGGRTLIFPPCGIDKFDISPLIQAGIETLSDLVKRAVVIFTQPPDALPSSEASFERNRLVAAQASALIVIEARQGSSTLNTVERAQKLKRPVFVQSYETITEEVMGNEMLRRGGAPTIKNIEDLDQVISLVKAGKS